ncbi:hypothetical protein H1R20_g16090, partial [Candolleomyces eurysporus]
MSSTGVTYCTLIITKGHSKPLSLGPGKLGCGVDVEFCDACKVYFLTKEIADNKKVLRILSSFKDFKHRQWIKLNRTDLLSKDWEIFIEEFLTCWTEKHWDMNLSDKLRTFSQGWAHFYEWAQDFCAQASHLEGTLYAMDKKQVCIQISALMDACLRLCTKTTMFMSIVNFNKWLDAVNNKYELYTVDLATATKFLKAQEAQAPPPKKQKTNHVSSATSLVVLSQSATSALTDTDSNQVCRLALTQDERKLLEANSSCFKC